MELLAIAAIGKNGELGYHNEMPWKRGLKKDLQSFKKETFGHPVVMGRKTFESMGRPLPGRINIVISETMKDHPGVEIFSSIEGFLKKWGPTDTCLYVIGGGKIYKELLPFCNELVLTETDRAFEADTWFPAFDREEFDCHFEQKETEDNGISWKRKRYIRKSPVIFDLAFFGK